MLPQQHTAPGTRATLLSQCPAQNQSSHLNRWKPNKPVPLPFQGTESAMTFSLVKKELIKRLIRDKALPRVSGHNSFNKHTLGVYYIPNALLGTTQDLEMTSRMY